MENHLKKLRRALWLAFQASRAVGMGLLHTQAASLETEESLFERVEKTEENNSTSIYVDYLLGRMMKTQFAVDTAGVLTINPEIPQIDYQSWKKVYDSGTDLIKAVENSFDTRVASDGYHGIDDPSGTDTVRDLEIRASDVQEDSDIEQREMSELLLEMLQEELSAFDDLVNKRLENNPQIKRAEHKLHVCRRNFEKLISKRGGAVRQRRLCYWLNQMPRWNKCINSIVADVTAQIMRERSVKSYI